MIQPGEVVEVPARYEWYLRAALTEALQHIKQDQAEPGSSPEIPEFVVFEQKQGTVMLLLLDVAATPVVQVRDMLAEVGRVAA